MSRKDYVAVAAAIRAELDKVNQMSEIPGTRAFFTSGIKATADALANVFASENSQFDRARFLAACGIN